VPEGGGLLPPGVVAPLMLLLPPPQAVSRALIDTNAIKFLILTIVYLPSSALQGNIAISYDVYSPISL